MADPTRPFDTVFDEVPFGLLLSQPDDSPSRDPMREWRQHNYDRMLNALAHTVGMAPVRQVTPLPPSLRGLQRSNDSPAYLSFLLEQTPVAAARDLVQSSRDLERASKANSAEGVASAGASGLVAAMGLAPGGRLAKGMVAAGSKVAPHLREGMEALTRINPHGLPMDVLNQQTRALEQRYGLDRRVFHASNRRYLGFDPGKTGEGAISLSDRIPMADSYIGYVPAPAHLAGPEAQRSFVDPNFARVYFHEQIYPVVLRDWDRFLTFDRGGKGYEPGLVQDALADARAKRAPGVVFKNMRDPGPANRYFDLPESQLPGTVVYLRKPNYARSPYAVFDPRRMHSRNLTAGLLPVAGLGMLAPYLPPPEERP